MLIGWLLISSPLVAQHLYVFSIIETSQPSRMTDTERLLLFTRNLARQANYTHHWFEFGGESQFTPQTVCTTLATFEPQSADEDVIWVHYTGRGYSDGPKAWPTLQLNGGDVALRELLALLRGKPVRTLLVTVDCDNTPRSSQQSPTTDQIALSANDSRRLLPSSVVSVNTQTNIPLGSVKNKGRYRHLLCPSEIRQIIVISSTSRGQRAHSSPTIGSMWLTALTDTFTACTERNVPGLSWKLIVEQTTQLMKKKTRNRQTPLMNRQTITCCETNPSN